jgi:hypothetical protein
LPIPDLQPNGFLPVGVHDCTVEELGDRFGRFRCSDRRPILTQKLICYIEELRDADIGKYLIVNGSFVTDIDCPNDIDVLLVLKDDVDLTVDIPPYRRNAGSRQYIQNHFGLDFHHGFEGDASATAMIDHWQEVKNRPGEVKGILRINL